MPDDHSKVVPLLPIPNRKVKRLSADDSADSRVKVGHRQASIIEKPSAVMAGGFFVYINQNCINLTVERCLETDKIRKCIGLTKYIRQTR
jgi:hypothetical protein